MKSSVSDWPVGLPTDQPVEWYGRQMPAQTTNGSQNGQMPDNAAKAGHMITLDWSSTIGGRGRRVVAGAARWVANLKAKGQLTGVVGAVPTFTFRGNKA